MADDEYYRITNTVKALKIVGPKYSVHLIHWHQYVDLLRAVKSCVLLTVYFENLALVGTAVT